MAHKNWQSVSRREHCPICNRPDNCKISNDGGAVWCGRVQAGSVKRNDGGQYLHLLRQEKADRSWTPPLRTTPSDRTQRTDLSELADRGFSHPDAMTKRSELANTLGVEDLSITNLNIGWESVDRSQGKWMIPERDGSGMVIGIQGRLINGDKRNLPGSRRGLVYAENWEEFPGPVYIVEGASDTAALNSMGRCAVGRPSNAGGAETLTTLLRHVPGDRPIIILGENDRKPHETLKPAQRERHNLECEGCSICWPGLFGAKKVASRLSQLLCRKVGWALPPDGYKDVREWYRTAKAEAVA